LYFLQTTLFSLEELQEMELKNRLTLLFSSLNLTPYANKLKSTSPQGAPGHDREAILRALLASPLEGIDKFTDLSTRLKEDIRFRYCCGFGISDNTPSVPTLSRVFAELTEKGLLEQLFYDLVDACYQEEIIDGTTIALDSTTIDAYEKKQPKSKQSSTNANWGAKFDSFKNKITWFGYKLHLAVDAESELPTALKVTPASVYDGDMGPELVKNIAKQGHIDKVDYITADGGYDQYKNYEIADHYNASAIIPLNLRNEKQPPAGITSNGTPCCSMGYEMTYWGYEKNYLKFRCPHATGKVDCPHGTLWCSDKDYGMVVKVNIKDDLRRYCAPHRDSINWQKIYNKRTSVERCYSRLKENLTVNQLHVGGIEKVKTHIYLNVIVLLASALAAKRQQENQKNLEKVAA